MTAHSHPPPLSDVCLLLRAHAEQSWLHREVMPVLVELKHREGLREEQLGAALAYLEVLWIDASTRAAETEAAHAHLLTADAACERGLSRRARGYHSAVCALRGRLASHVAHLLAVPAAPPLPAGIPTRRVDHHACH
jgi:hypothetical protein